MDIVKFWHDQTTKWNDEQKCGFCWEFGAPLEEQTTNIQQLKDEVCCVRVFLTDSNFSETPSYAPNGFVNETECRENFTLWILIPSHLGINNWSEINGYSTEESKWATIFQPLKDCLACDKVIDYCSILGYKIDIPKWEGRLVTNYQDMNYSGWKINGSFRIKS